MSDTYRVLLDDCKILERDLRKRIYSAEDDSREQAWLKDALAQLNMVGASVVAAMHAAKKEGKE